MRSQLRMLLWKEWRERRAQFWLCMAWGVGLTLYQISYEATHHLRASVAAFSSLLLFGMLAAIFAAMRTAQGENRDRTRAFSDGLPVAPRLRGWIRLAGGAAVVMTPILVGALLLSVCLATGWFQQAPPRPPQGPDYVQLAQRTSLSPLGALGFLWTVTLIVSASTTTFYLLLAWLGMKLRAEAHVGFVGAALAFLWFIGGEQVIALYENGWHGAATTLAALNPGALFINCGYGDEQGNSYGDLLFLSTVVTPLLMNLAFQAGLAVVYVRRYARQFSGRVSQRVRQAKRVWLPWAIPLPSRGLALTWLTLRQSLPMCLPGLVIAAGIAWLELGSETKLGMADHLASTMWYVGAIWASVVGAGVFASETDGRLGEFWRTRPLSSGKLFAIKFVVGLLAVLLVLDGTTIALGWCSPNWGGYNAMNRHYLACMVPLHVVIYVLAVAWTCVLCRPVLGGIASLVSFYLPTALLETFRATQAFDPVEVYNHSFILDPNRDVAGPLAPEYPITFGIMAILALAALAVAYASLRRYRPAL